MLQVFVTEYNRPENKQFIFYKRKDKNRIEPSNFFTLMPKAGHVRGHFSIITIRGNRSIGDESSISITLAEETCRF